MVRRQHCRPARAMLTLRDINYLHLKICGELLTYLSREAAGELDGSEREHLEYLKGLSDRLHAAEEAAA
jgi:hypothetical protein